MFVFRPSLLFTFLSCSAWQCAALAHGALESRQSKVCTVTPSLNSSIDDAPAILKAFSDCGQGGTVAFENHTYFVNTVMNTTGLKNVVVDLQGTLEVMITPSLMVCM